LVAGVSIVDIKSLRRASLFSSRFHRVTAKVRAMFKHYALIAIFLVTPAQAAWSPEQEASEYSGRRGKK
jgi:hypothetical protein